MDFQRTLEVCGWNVLVVGLNLRICGTRQTFCFRAWPQTKFAKSFFFFSLKSFAFQTVVFWDDPWKALKEFGGIHDHYDACENEKLQKTSTSILNFDWKICLCFFLLLSQLRLVFLENYFLTYFIYIFHIWNIHHIHEVSSSQQHERHSSAFGSVFECKTKF